MTSIPNFFMMVGFPKCGTTSMADWISQHPCITLSNPKEPRFFEREYWLGLEYYLDTYFKNSFNTFNGEARILNATTLYVIPRIIEMIGHPKIIFMVRDPVERFISEWNYFKIMRPGREIRSRYEAIRDSMINYDLDYWNSEERFCENLDPAGTPYRIAYLEHGCYAYYIKKYMEHFDCHICVLNDVVKSPKKEYDKIVDFIGAIEFTPRFNLKKVNQYEKVKSEILKEFYKDSVEELSELMNRDLSKEWGYK